MHRLAANFVLGYHGCDEAVARRLLKGEPFRQSNNAYDWLGPGIYFWEANPKRALEFAGEVAERSPSLIRRPAVVGAVIDLGHCLDLSTSAGIGRLKIAYRSLKQDKVGNLPKNGKKLLLRYLDCAVLNRLHAIHLDDAPDAPIETVRGIFVEGNPAYPGAGFRDKTHVQIAVCNPDNIKGVFRVGQNL